MNMQSGATINVSDTHGIGPAPIQGRASHTADLAAYDRYLKEVQETRRAATDTPFSQRFWSFVRGQLEACTAPVGYEETEDATATVQKGPKDVGNLINRVMALGLFFPIHPIRLAEAAGVSHLEVITELLFATKAGLMEMRWAPECVQCGSAATITS